MSDVTIDYLDIVKLLNKLDNDTLTGVLLTSSKKAADELRDRTREILLQKLPAASVPSKYNKTMVKGVQSKVDKDYTLSYVTIMREHKLKWFEMGTKPRFRKIRYSGKDKRGHERKVLRKDNMDAGTGQIQALNFFLQARQEYADQICDDMEKTIIESLKKITENQIT